MQTDNVELKFRTIRVKQLVVRGDKLLCVDESGIIWLFDDSENDWEAFINPVEAYNDYGAKK